MLTPGEADSGWEVKLKGDKKSLLLLTLKIFLVVFYGKQIN